MSLLNIANEALEQIRASKQSKTHRGIMTHHALSTVPGGKVIELSKHKPKRLTLPCRHCGGRMAERWLHTTRRRVFGCSHCGMVTP